MSAPLHIQGVAALSRALAEGQVSSVELTQSLLEGIGAHIELGAFLATDAELSLRQARAADARRAAGKAGVLTGVPVAHCDIQTRGLPTTAGSRILAGYASPSRTVGTPK
jgi:aspartyl-tRNA(Asn)/glutamyl-tRNA(Gln) amidotransferase subunit A